MMRIRDYPKCSQYKNIILDILVDKNYFIHKLTHGAREEKYKLNKAIDLRFIYDVS